MDKLVSICIPTHNGERFIEEAVLSAVNQTYENIEIVISDDHSTDNTIDRINKVIQQTSFRNIRIIHHTPSSVAANWNNCVKHAQGEYIKFLFQDDVLAPDCVKAMVQIMEKHPEVALVASKRSFIIDDSMREKETVTHWLDMYGNLQRQFEKKHAPVTIIDKSLFKKKYFLLNPKNKIGEPSTILFRKKLFDNTKYHFDSSFSQILDYVFYYRILRHYKIAVINRNLVKFRLHTQQLTHQNRQKDIQDYERYPQLLYKEFFYYLPLKTKIKLLLTYSPFFKPLNVKKWKI